MYSNPSNHFVKLFVLFAVTLCISIGCKDETSSVSDSATKVPTKVKVDNNLDKVQQSEEKTVVIPPKEVEKRVAPPIKEESKTKPEVPQKKPKPKKRRPKLRPAIEFELDRYDFGEIDQGDTVDVDFKFTNTGKGPLVINTVKVTCGCTQPSYPFIPIEPGEEGTIGIKYVSVGKEGAQKPLVTVYSNASKEPISLTLSGIVNVPKKEEVKDTLSPKTEALDSLQKKASSK